MNQNDVLAVIPAWNEASQIAKVVDSTLEKLPVLVVDDGSHDETAKEAAQAGATVIRHRVNQGKGRALVAGFRYALNKRFRGVMTIDADGQHDPADIPAFLNAFHGNQRDLVLGRRDFHFMPLTRRISNGIGSRMLSWILNQYIPDGLCGFRLYSQKLIRSVSITARRFEVEAELLCRVICQRMTVEWVPIRTIYKKEIKSHFNTRVDIPLFIKTIWHFRGCRKRVA